MISFSKKRTFIFAVCICVAILSGIVAKLLFNNEITRAANFPTFTASDGSKWYYDVTTTNTKTYLKIGYSTSTDPNITSIKVPSLSEAVEAVVDATGDTSLRDLDTYYIVNMESSPTMVVPTAPAGLKKIDMTDTSKVQIVSLAPLLDTTEEEVELVFGDNMVLQDPMNIGNISYGSTDKGIFEGKKINIQNFEKIKYVARRAFANTTINQEDTDVTFYNNQTFGEYVFTGSNVKSITFHSDMIPGGVCDGCQDLTTITVGDEVETIHHHAFSGTTALTGVDINKTVNVMNSAFENSAISSLTIGEEAKFIGASAFKNTKSLTGSVDFKNIQTFAPSAFEGSNITGASFDNNAVNFETRSFYGTKITSLDFTNQSPRFGVSSFENSEIAELNLGNTVIISSYAFKDNNIQELYIPKTFVAQEFPNLNANSYPLDAKVYSPVAVTGQAGRIAGMFANNPIKKLTVAFDTNTITNTPYTYAIFGPGTGKGSVDLEELILVAPYGENDEVSPYFITSDSGERGDAGWNTSFFSQLVAGSKNVVGAQAFYGIGAKKITIGEGYEVIKTTAFQGPIPSLTNNGELRELVLPSTLKAIGLSAFAYVGNSEIALDSLPSNVEYIGYNAFGFGSNFTVNNLDLPKLRYLGSFAFTDSNTKNITLHDKLEYLGEEAFYHNFYIDNLTFDFDVWNSNISWIGRGKFTSVIGGWLEHPYDNDDNDVPACTDDQEGDARCPFHYGKIKFTSKAVTPMPTSQYTANFTRIYADEIDMSETSWTAIGTGTFIGARIGTLKLPLALQSIGDAAMYKTKVKNAVTLPGTLRSIGKYTFQDSNVNMTSLPTSIESINNAAFYNAQGFTADVDLPNLTYLGNSAFQGSNIRDLTLRDSIQTLGINAFYNTPSLRNVTIDMDLYSFNDAHKVKDLQILSEINKRITNEEDAKAAELGRELTEAEKAEIEELYDYDQDFYRSFAGTFGHDHKYGKIKFTSKAGEPCGGFENCAAKFAYFADLEAAEVDLSETDWTITSRSMFQGSSVDKIILPNSLETVGQDSFYEVNLHEIVIPTSLHTIDEEGFQWAKGDISTLPEGLTTINRSAFFGSDLTDDLVIPSTVTHIGKDAFNAGDADVHYDTVTVKPDLTYSETSDQPMFVVFYNNEIDKLIINSSDLPTLHAGDGIPEFHAMTVKEAEITDLNKISDNAFEECEDLTKVDLSQDTNLEAIGNEAFIDAITLDTIIFSDSIQNKTVTIGQNAFKNTAFKTIGKSDADIDLTAAKFDASASLAFANMPQVVSVDVPATFSNATIPEGTFYNNPELETANIDYRITEIGKGAFADDNKLKSIFIWGNTTIKDDNLTGERTRGGTYGPTIPAGTDIYAYSTSPAEEYAADSSRDNFEGVFYPLDEVLVITSNHPSLKMNEDEDDFDKTDLIIYALRRDGIILESDEWGVYDGVAKPRSEYEGLVFENLSALAESRPVFAAIHDTMVPINELSLSNENFENIGYDIAPEGNDTFRITVKYNDAYTDFLSTTDLIAYGEPEEDPTPEEDPEEEEDPIPAVPNTGLGKAVNFFFTIGLPISAVIVSITTGGYFLFRRIKK